MLKCVWKTRIITRERRVASGGLVQIRSHRNTKQWRGQQLENYDQRKEGRESEVQIQLRTLIHLWQWPIPSERCVRGTCFKLDAKWVSEVQGKINWEAHYGKGPYLLLQIQQKATRFWFRALPNRVLWGHSSYWYPQRKCLIVRYRCQSDIQIEIYVLERLIRGWFSRVRGKQKWNPYCGRMFQLLVWRAIRDRARQVNPGWEGGVLRDQN